MEVLDIAQRRLSNQRISQAKFNRPGKVVTWLGAIQAQDYANAKWAVGLRCSGATDASIEQAIAERAILRTWLLRGTLHLVAPDDVHWMLALLAPRLIASGERRDRQLELDDATYTRAFGVLIGALDVNRQLTRKELRSALERAGMSTQGQRGYHILARAALQGLICLGPYHGKEQTFVLLDEWAPSGRRLEGEEALAELARRYISSHGPATLADFIWWSGLAARDARAGLEMIKHEIGQETIAEKIFWWKPQETVVREQSPRAYLLPGFDEYYLGYTDRSFLLETKYERRAVSSNGVFQPILVIDGQVVGTWKRKIKKGAVIILLQPFGTLSEAEGKALEAAAMPYGAFLGLPVEFS
jgi:hypothetical protein